MESIKKCTQGIMITIGGKPNAKISKVTEINNQYIGVSIAAQPREGEANEELISYMCGIFGVKKSGVYIDKGSKSRHKVLIVETQLTV